MGRVVIVIIDEGTVSGAGNSAAFAVGPVAHAVLEFDAEADLELITDAGLRS